MSEVKTASRFNYIISKFITGFIVVFFIISLVFVLIHLAPGDPVTLLGGEYAASEEYYDKLRETYGLDKPLHEQYFLYLFRVIQGDFGFSIWNAQDVRSLIAEAIPRTVILMSTAMVGALIIGIILGIIAAKKKNTIIDVGIRTISLIGNALPLFWVGELLLLLFSIRLGWFPSIGIQSFTNKTGIEALLDYLRHLALPATTEAVFYIGLYTLLIRSNLMEELSKEYVVTAKSKGLTENQIIKNHVLKPAFLPVITVSGLNLGFMFSASLVIETIFAYPGTGYLTYSAILRRDYNLVLGMFIILSITVVVANIITDIIYSYFDPRVMYQ